MRFTRISVVLVAGLLAVATTAGAIVLAAGSDLSGLIVQRWTGTAWK